MDDGAPGKELAIRRSEGHRAAFRAASATPPLHTTPRTASDETPRIVIDETVGRVRKTQARVTISGIFGKPLDASMANRRHLESHTRENDDLEDQVSGRWVEYQVKKMGCVFGTTRPCSIKIRDILRTIFCSPDDLRACVPAPGSNSIPRE